MRVKWQGKRYDNERIQNAALYFVQNTKRVGMVKLCKLFYFYDMEVYTHLCFTATGLTYIAKECGPVPLRLWLELENKPGEYLPTGISQVIYRKNMNAGSDESFFVARRNKEFEPDHFAPKELEILEKLVNKFKTCTGNVMSEETHLKGKPWEQTWAEGKGDGEEIDFDLEASLHYDMDEMDMRKRIQNELREFHKQVEAINAGKEPC